MNKPLILAVDDDAVNLDIIRLTFEDSDLSLQFARGGREALAILQDPASCIDLILLDRMMPEVDGMEVLRQIKATSRLTSLPVVMQTAAAVPNQVEEGLLAGAYYYLTKPYSPETLRTIVRSALEDSQRRARVQQTPADSNKGWSRLSRGEFFVRTLDEAMELTDFLSSFCPDPVAAWTGLKELLANAIEHGNLGITYEEKRALKLEERWREEVDRRAALPEYSARRVRVVCERLPKMLRFIVADEGQGFPWRNYLEFDPSRAFDPNGRGIALARALCFKNLYYEGRGNVAVATIALPD